nr:torsin-1A-like [Halyomorpha halys]
MLSCNHYELSTEMNSINFLWLMILMSFVSLSLELTYFNSLEKFFGLERCNSNWIKKDIEGLSSDLKSKVFGQPLIGKALLSSLKFFLENDNPSKPFVMSFHGSPGTGKTMVSQLIAANMYFKGTKSKFYRHYTMADTHFVSQIELIDDIKTRAKNCERSLFVFDEIEKMPNGTFDALKPFLDFHHEVIGIDFRKNVFIFISNNGMNKINSITKDLWYNGVKREEIKLSSFDKSLFTSALNEEGTIYYFFFNVYYRITNVCEKVKERKKMLKKYISEMRIIEDERIEVAIIIMMKR